MFGTVHFTVEDSTTIYSRTSRAPEWWGSGRCQSPGTNNAGNYYQKIGQYVFLSRKYAIHTGKLMVYRGGNGVLVNGKKESVHHSGNQQITDRENQISTGDIVILSAEY